MLLTGFIRLRSIASWLGRLTFCGTIVVLVRVFLLVSLKYDEWSESTDSNYFLWFMSLVVRPRILRLDWTSIAKLCAIRSIICWLWKGIAFDIRWSFFQTMRSSARLCWICFCNVPCYLRNHRRCFNDMSVVSSSVRWIPSGYESLT